MKATDLEQVQRYLQLLRTLAPHTVWFGSVSAEVDQEWEWMLEARGGGLPSSTEIVAFEMMARGGGKTRPLAPFIGGTTERRHKGVRMTIDVGSAHLHFLARSAELKPFGAWLERFYADFAALYAEQAPVWEPGQTRVPPAAVVKMLDDARAQWE